MHFHFQWYICIQMKWWRWWWNSKKNYALYSISCVQGSDISRKIIIFINLQNFVQSALVIQVQLICIHLWTASFFRFLKLHKRICRKFAFCMILSCNFASRPSWTTLLHVMPIHGCKLQPLKKCFDLNTLQNIKSNTI